MVFDQERVNAVDNVGYTANNACEICDISLKCEVNIKIYIVGEVNVC